MIIPKRNFKQENMCIYTRWFKTPYKNFKKDGTAQ